MGASTRRAGASSTCLSISDYNSITSERCYEELVELVMSPITIHLSGCQPQILSAHIVYLLQELAYEGTVAQYPLIRCLLDSHAP